MQTKQSLNHDMSFCHYCGLITGQVVIKFNVWLSNSTRISIIRYLYNILVIGMSYMCSSSRKLSCHMQPPLGKRCMLVIVGITLKLFCSALFSAILYSVFSAEKRQRGSWISLPASISMKKIYWCDLLSKKYSFANPTQPFMIDH